MFTYAQVYCQERWRKELQVRKAFSDTNTVNVRSSFPKRPNSRISSGAMCHRGQSQTSEASEEMWKKKLGPVKRNLVMVCLSWRIQPQFFSLPIYIIVSLFRVSLLWGERLFTEGLLPICWDNKSSSKLRDVALYMCGHMIKPHCLLSSKMKVASLLFSNTNIDFQRISLHRLPVAKSSLSKPGKCILFSFSLHSAVKKKHH